MLIPRKEIKSILETIYEKPQRLIKILIQELQNKDNWVKFFKVNGDIFMAYCHIYSQAWALDIEGLLIHNDHLYVLKDETLKEKLVSQYYDDPLARHFNVEKTYELLTQKYY